MIFSFYHMNESWNIHQIKIQHNKHNHLKELQHKIIFLYYWKNQSSY